MSEMEGRSDSGLALGQVYVEVEYDYEYKAKDKLISIHPGECYMLVKKTNSDWWQVKRDDGTKAFYVPAQYVREVRRALMPPPKARIKPPITLPIALPVNRGSSVSENPQHRSSSDMVSFGRPSTASTPSPLPEQHTPPLLMRDSNQNAGMKDVLAELALHNNNNHHNHHHGNTALLPCTRPESPSKEPPGCRGKPQGVSPSDTEGSSPGNVSEVLRHDSESGDELSSSSTEHTQTVSPVGHSRSESPVYTNLRDLKVSHSSLPPVPSTSPLHALGDWETHKDVSGRHFYYNKATQERTWKPPRSRDTIGGSRGDATNTADMELSEKCGVLNVTKITEHGKKVRKNWTSSWTVLQGSTLAFSKGQNSTSSWFGGNQSKPEFDVDLRGGSVEWASKEKSSKKHVIEIKTHQGTELLIQSEIDNVITDWYRALTEVVSTHAWESDEAIEEDMPESPGSEKQDKEKEHRDSKKSKSVKNANMESADQKKTRVKLKKFLTRRPTLQSVRDKGYIKDQVFGCSLTSLSSNENSSVPNFVRMCIDHVEKTGLDIDGLYRVSGNLAVIQKLRFAVNHDEKVDLTDSKWEDIHVITGALKMFFRELPEPLFTYSFFNDFVHAIKISDYRQRVHATKDLIRQLPKPNQETMQVLFRHLKRVIEHGEENRMTTQSVAIVFGPTLLRPETENGNMAVHMVYQNQIVELILLEYDNIFGR